MYENLTKMAPATESEPPLHPPLRESPSTPAFKFHSCSHFLQHYVHSSHILSTFRIFSQKRTRATPHVNATPGSVGEVPFRFPKTWTGSRLAPALRTVSYHLFQVLDLNWRSPESGALWCKSRKLKKTIRSRVGAALLDGMLYHCGYDPCGNIRCPKASDSPFVECKLI